MWGSRLMPVYVTGAAARPSYALTKSQQDGRAHGHPEEFAPLGSGDVDVGHQGKQDPQADDQLIDRAQGATNLGGGDLHGNAVGLSETRGRYLTHLQ